MYICCLFARTQTRINSQPLLSFDIFHISSFSSSSSSSSQTRSIFGSLSLFKRQVSSLGLFGHTLLPHQSWTNKFSPLKHASKVEEIKESKRNLLQLPLSGISISSQHQRATSFCLTRGHRKRRVHSLRVQWHTNEWVSEEEEDKVGVIHFLSLCVQNRSSEQQQPKAQRASLWPFARAAAVQWHTLENIGPPVSLMVYIFYLRPPRPVAGPEGKFRFFPPQCQSHKHTHKSLALISEISVFASKLYCWKLYLHTTHN